MKVISSILALAGVCALAAFTPAEAACNQALVKYSSDTCNLSGCYKTCAEGDWELTVQKENLVLGSKVNSGDGPCKKKCPSYSGKYTSGDSVELTNIDDADEKITVSKDGSNMLKVDSGNGCMTKFEVTQGCILDADANGASLRTLPSAFFAMAAGAVTALVGGMRRRV